MVAEELTFEEALAELQSTVGQLENGSLPLEELLALYEKGQKLVVICQGYIDKAQLRVEQLSADGEIAPRDEM